MTKYGLTYAEIQRRLSTSKENKYLFWKYIFCPCFIGSIAGIIAGYLLWH